MPADAVDAARSTLAGAIQVAEGLPTRLGTELAEVARAAFTAGMQFSAWFSAVMMLGLAVLAAIALRPFSLHTPTSTPPRTPSAGTCR